MVLMPKLEKNIKGIVITQLESFFHQLKEIKSIQQDKGIRPNNSVKNFLDLYKNKMRKDLNF